MSDKRKQERKRHRRQERLRQKRHRRRSHPSRPPGEGLDEELPPPEMPPPMSSMAMERDMRALTRALEEGKFGSKADLDAFLAQLKGRRLDEVLGSQGGDDPKERAQELAYEALDASNAFEAAKLARQALELDPDCVDAHLSLAMATTPPGEERIARLREALAAGEHSLGEEYFKENRGHFWGLTRTRPYMRARGALADELLDVGRVEEAIGHLEGMLELNPNDNQGYRDVLLGAYLRLGNPEGTRRLLARYESTIGATFHWGRVLERLMAGDEAGAAEALERARKVNPHAEKYLNGRKEPPKETPDSYSPGDEAEARLCARCLCPAWAGNLQATTWLSARGRQ